MQGYAANKGLQHLQRSADSLEREVRPLNVYQGHVSKLESGKVQPNKQTLDRIVKALGKKLIIAFQDED